MDVIGLIGQLWSVGAIVIGLLVLRFPRLSIIDNKHASLGRIISALWRESFRYYS